MRHALILFLGLLLSAGCASRQQGAIASDPAGAAAAADEPTPAVEAPVSGDAVEPSVIGFDRSNWPTLVVHPADGTVRHPPAYLGGRSDPTLAAMDLSRLTPEERVDLALAPAYEGSRWAETFWEPIRFAGDVLMLPVAVVRQQPSGRAASPARGGSAAASSAPQRGGLLRGQGDAGQPGSGNAGSDTGGGAGSVGSGGGGGAGGL